MVSSKPQRLINTCDAEAVARVNFAQYCWVLLSVSAAVACLIGGAEEIVCITSFFVAILPVAVWFAANGAARQVSGMFSDLLIAAWALAGFAALAVTGGALSQLGIVLLLGPLTLLAMGQYRSACEALAISLLVLAAGAAAGTLGWAASAPDRLAGLVVPWTAAAIGQGGVLAFLAGATLLPTRTVRAEPKEAPAATQALGLTLPLLLVDVSPLGRIRRIEGPEALRWPGLRIGQLADELGIAAHAGKLVAPGGRAFRVRRSARPDGGCWIALLEAEEAGGRGAPPSQEATELAARAEAAEQALADRTAFFAGLGHDLKTPLNAILGFSDLMKAELRGPLPDAYKDYPAIIHESGQDLMLLVEDILDLAKTESLEHRLDLEPVDLVASGGSILRQLEDMAQRAGVTLALEADGEVWADADPRAVRQIWQNLVSNAIKYSDKGGTVSLSAGASGGSVFLSVEDDGAGMDQADLDRIAAPFAQGANAKGRAGTGLGLAVVHRFAQLHGGRVIIDTAPGEGTRVRVMLPAADAGLIGSLEDAAQ